MRTFRTSPGATEIRAPADNALVVDGRSTLVGRKATTLVGVRSMMSNGSASVLEACAPPIQGPSPGTIWQPARARARPRATTTGRATGHTQVQVFKLLSPSGAVGISPAPSLVSP